MRHGSDTVPQVGERPRTAPSGFRSRAFFVPEPGFSLARFLGEARSEGRPVWHLTDEVTVPRLDWTGEGGRPKLAPSKMPPVVLAFLSTGDSNALRALTSRSERRVLDRLTAAVMRDLFDRSPEEITDWLGYENKGEAKKLAREGRRLWGRLGAWPWWGLTPGVPPDRWWEQPVVVELLARWYLGYGGAHRHGPMGRRLAEILGRELV